MHLWDIGSEGEEDRSEGLSTRNDTILSVVGQNVEEDRSLPLLEVPLGNDPSFNPTIPKIPQE